MKRRLLQVRIAFTLVELLVVIAIIGVLVGLLLPAVNAAREAARRTQCINNIRNAGLAVTVHHDAVGNYPSGRNTRDPMGVSWGFRLLPYVEEQAIHDAYDATHRVDDDENSIAMRNPVAIFFCPSRRPPVANRNFDNNDTTPLVKGVAAGGDFAANAGVYFNYADEGESQVDRKIAGPVFTFSKIRNRNVTDGTSKTFSLGERHIPPADPTVPDDMVHWQQGDCAFFAADTPHGLFADTSRGLANSPRDTNNQKYGSLHPSITLFVFFDAHVQAMSNDTDLDTLRWYCAIGDGFNPESGQPPGNGT